MRIDYVNQKIMEALLERGPTVRIAPLSATEDTERYIVCAGGFVAYVLECDEIYFNIGRCAHDPAAFNPLLSDDTLIRIDNMLDPTLDIRVAAKEHVTLAHLLDGGTTIKLLSRFKGADWDTLVDTDFLGAFDDAKYYQAKKYGPIAVVEGGKLVGYVMPTKNGDADGHYTDSRSYEDD